MNRGIIRLQDNEPTRNQGERVVSCTKGKQKSKLRDAKLHLKLR